MFFQLLNCEHLVHKRLLPRRSCLEPKLILDQLKHVFILHRLQIKTVLRYELHESGMGNCEKLGLWRCRLEVFDSIPKEGVLNKLSR